MKTYSQNNEQQYIVEYFKSYSSGKFLDIGAFDAYALSNTRALYELGFKGVLVEPCPYRYDIIKEQYKDDPEMIVFDKAISSTRGVVDFYITQDALSTIEKSHLVKWNKHKFEKTTVETVIPTDLFDKFGYNFDFISLDVESNNLDVMKHIPFDKLTNLKMFIVEHDKHDVEMTNIITPFGFKQIHKNQENIIFVK